MSNNVYRCSSCKKTFQCDANKLSEVVKHFSYKDLICEGCSDEDKPSVDELHSKVVLAGLCNCL